MLADNRQSSVAVENGDINDIFDSKVSETTTFMISKWLNRYNSNLNGRLKLFS